MSKGISAFEGDLAGYSDGSENLLQDIKGAIILNIKHP